VTPRSFLEEVSPIFPERFTASMTYRLPYADIEIPLRVVNTPSRQSVSYYDGLMVEVADLKEGHYKYVYRSTEHTIGSERVCLHDANTAGPTATDEELPLAYVFTPNTTSFHFHSTEFVRGILCQRFVTTRQHGSTGTMDDSVSFYWDPVLSKPVRWHMHSRDPVFNSHTDEYILDYLTFDPFADDKDMKLPALCETKTETLNHDKQVQSQAAGLIPRHSGVDATSFDAYVTSIGKRYVGKEYQRRKAIFEENMALMGAAAVDGAARFVVRDGMELTHGERSARLGGRKRQLSDSELVEVHRTTTVDLPRDFDWRVERPEIMNKVKDQAVCGSCWAFAFTTSTESRMSLHTGNSIVRLPEQFVLDCLWSNVSSACDGGDSGDAALQIASRFDGRVPTEADYGPYLGVDGYCHDTPGLDTGARVSGWVAVPTRDERAMLEALVTQGPLAVVMATPPELTFYDGGVLNLESCERTTVDDIDHEVVLVGYGHDEAARVDYYTIRNSWSTYWGDKGYFRIARGKRDCQISTQAGYAKLRYNQTSAWNYRGTASLSEDHSGFIFLGLLAGLAALYATTRTPRREAADYTEAPC